MTEEYPQLRLGTRASPLAMAQAYAVQAALQAAHPGLDVEICPVVASGDKVTDRALSEVGGKALWTKELDVWLSGGDIDISVHSMKDVETQRPPELTIAAMMERADVHDRLIGAACLDDLPPGARIGTSAPRRTAQLLRLRPDAQIVLFRGNVATRLARLERGEAEATLLAAAGLDRLAMAETGTAIPIETMLPAPAQGAIGIETRSDNGAVHALILAINHADTFDCVMAERAFLAGLNAGCQSPVAALGVIEGDRVWLRATLYSPDGTQALTAETRFARVDRDAPYAFAVDLLAHAHPAIAAVFG